MKSKVLIFGSLNNCKRTLAKINIDLIDSFIFITNEKDRDNNWFKDKNKILINDIKGLKYDLVFIAAQTVSEFREFQRTINKARGKK